MLALIATVTLLAAAEEVANPVLKPLAKGADHLVHAVAYPSSSEGYSGLGGRSVGGRMILHTVPSTGIMTPLVTSGTWAVPTRRLSYSQLRIVGVSADAQRLYVATWESGRMWDRPASKPEANSGTYRLSVFWLADGSKIQEFALTVKRPDAVPAETTENGVIEPGDSGLTVLGETFRFREKLPVK